MVLASLHLSALLFPKFFLKRKKMSLVSNACSFQFRPYSIHIVTSKVGSGKSWRVAQYLRNKDLLFENGPQIKRVYYFYSVWQNQFEELKRENVVTHFYNFCPTAKEFLDLFTETSSRNEECIVCIDDYMSDIGKDFVDITATYCRHLKVNLFILVQSLFQPGIDT